MTDTLDPEHREQLNAMAAMKYLEEAPERMGHCPEGAKLVEAAMDCLYKSGPLKELHDAVS